MVKDIEALNTAQTMGEDLQFERILMSIFS
jgi:hypothetical protein